MRNSKALKAVILSAVSALAITLVPPISNAAPKVAQGAACKSLNKKSTVQDKTFTCIKKNGKLVWSKGVAAKVNNNSASNSNEPPSTIDLRAKLYKGIYERYLKADKKMSPSFNFVRCPNVNNGMAKMTEDAYVDAYSFWAPIYNSNSKVNWLLMSEKDWDCWYETAGIFEGPNSGSRMGKTWNKDTGVMGHCNVSSRVFCGYGTGVQGTGVFAQYNLIGSSYKIAPTPLTVHHETVHIYQMQLQADNFSTSKKNTMACWFDEGQANLFGVPIALKGDPTDHRNMEIRRLLQVYPKGSTYTKDEWLKVLNDLKNERDFCFKNELGYSLGWFALEWTYMNYSIEEMHKFLESISKGQTWEEAIQSIMKMDEQTYLGKIAQYLADDF